MAELRHWQAARLSRTYSDLRADARYAPAVEFFLSDLYGAYEFGVRDHELARASNFLERALPAAPLAALRRAVELDVLTTELDHAMLPALPEGPLDEHLYARAYRQVGRREARERQIDLVVATGEDLDHAVRHRWVGPLLYAAHAPAHAAGFGELQDFIERGYGAFRKMSDAGAFLAIIRERETRLMEALFSGAKDPFARASARTS
jgi:hypothetical protein